MRGSIVLVLAGLYLEAVSASLRGVDPAVASRYDSQRGQFSCFDRSKTLPHKWINDNYCDCTDGSDEPGTSACPNGHFYCRNRGHEPRVINSSMVEDGICDCCDGTDEPPGRCMNTCLEAGASARAELRARAAAYAAGAKVRESYIKEAVTARADWQAQLKRLKAQAAAQQHKVDKAKGRQPRRQRRLPAVARKGGLAMGHPATSARASRLMRAGSRHRQVSAKKEQIDAEEKAEREEAAENARKEADAQKEREASKQVETSKLEVAAGDQSTTPLDTKTYAKVEPREPVQQGEQQQEQQDAAALTAQLTPDEEAKQRLAQWVHDPGQDGAEEPAPAEYAAEAGDVAEEGEEPEEVLIEPNQPLQRAGLWVRAKQWVLQLLGRAGALTPEAAKSASRQAVKDDFHAHQNKLTDLNREATDLERRLALDLGPQGEYLPLVDQCYETPVDKYKYSVCMFKDAHQKDGHALTRLGNWAGWEGDGAVASFTNGQGCWQGPSRSMRVTVECGRDEALMDVQEPNRCEYVAKLTTPAACTPQQVASVQSLVTSAERDVLDHTEL